MMPFAQPHNNTLRELRESRDVKENNKRKSLHWHAAVLAGLTPALVSDAVHIEHLRTIICDILDQHFCGELPFGMHAASVAEGVLHMGGRREAAQPIPARSSYTSDDAYVEQVKTNGARTADPCLKSTWAFLSTPTGPLLQGGERPLRNLFCTQSPRVCPA